MTYTTLIPNGLPLVKRSLALEMIDVQKDDFGAKIEALHLALQDKIMSGKYDYTRAIRDSVEVQAIVNLTQKRLGLKTDFIVNSIPGAIMPVYLNKHHVFIPEMYRGKFTIPDQQRAIDRLKTGSTGGVDMANARLSGIFTQYENKIFMNYDVFFKQMDMTAGEVTAILLHEFGHGFNAYAYSDKIRSNNMIMAKIAEHITVNKKNSDLKFVYTELKRVSNKITEEEVEKMVTGDRVIAGYYWYKLAVEANGLNDQSATMVSNYDRTAFESLSDDFATRFGYGEQLVTGLEKFYKNGFPSPERSKSMWVFMHVMEISFLCIELTWIFEALALGSFPTVIIAGLFIAMRFYMDSDSGEDRVYDKLKDRYTRVRQQMIEILKDTSLSREESRDLVSSIERVDDIIKQTGEYKSIYNLLAKLLIPDSRKVAGYVDEQRVIESLAFNDMFLQAAKLRNI